MENTTKLSEVKKCLAQNDLQGALRIAAKFQKLGEHKAQIVRAHEAFVRPAFYKQLGKNIEETKEAGRLALIARFGE